MKRKLTIIISSMQQTLERAIGDQIEIKKKQLIFFLVMLMINQILKN